MFTLWLHHQDTFQVIFRKNTLKSDGNKEGESSRDDKGMITSEDVANRIYLGYKNKKKRLDFYLQG